MSIVSVNVARYNNLNRKTEMITTASEYTITLTGGKANLLSRMVPMLC